MHGYCMKALQFLCTALICVCSVVGSAQSSTPTMKAIVVQEYGGPEVLKFEDSPRPEPKDDQVLIRAGNSAKSFGTRLPFIPGYDIAGIVEKPGTRISKLKVGDEVYAYLSLDRGGGYAEYAVATEVEAASKPKSIRFESAAAVPLAALTAWQALIDAAKLSPGQTVLIHGGSGANHGASANHK
jgi:NADPH:quinone reductase-like Zn-dependent oxidoreductase